MKKTSFARRDFLRLAAGSAAFAALKPLEALGQPTARPGPVIDKITVLRVPGAFYRPIAMNAYDDAPKGKAGTTRLARVFLSDGKVGAGRRGVCTHR